jgi:hypothetical protein
VDLPNRRFLGETFAILSTTAFMLLGLAVRTTDAKAIYEIGPGPQSRWLPVSSDGKWLLFSQLDEQSSDLMMIENWR